METQRFERLMEYFKNEDNNIDFMVRRHTINSILILLGSLKNPTSPSKPQIVLLPCHD